MVALSDVAQAAKFSGKIRTGLAAALGAPMGIGDAYYATDTDELSVSENGSTWVTYDLGAIGTVAVHTVRAHNTSNQTINNSTTTVLDFTAEAWDTDAFHSNVSNSDRLTIPLDGKYAVYGAVLWTNNAAYPTSQLYLEKNAGVGGDVYTFPGSTFNFTLNLVAGDYLKLHAFQASGSNRTVNPAYFGMEWRGA